VGVNLGEVPDVFIARIVLADTQDFLVAQTLVEHFQDADRTNFHDTAGKAGSVYEDEDVEGVAVIGEGAGDKAIVSRIVDGRIEIAVETENVVFLVILVLVAALIGNLDDSVDDLGAVRPNGEFQVIRHKIGGSLLFVKDFAVAGVMPPGASEIPGSYKVVSGQKRLLVYNQTG
jgi:hypothetical protein